MATSASSVGSEPLEFVLGEGNVIPGFEHAVRGMSPGDTKTTTIPAAEAYGPHEPAAVFDVPRSQLPADVEPQVGVVPQQAGEARPEPEPRERARGPDRDPAADRPVTGGDRLECVVDPREVHPQLFREPSPVVGEADAATDPLEQRHRELDLEGPHLLRHRGHRDAPRLGGGGERGPARGGHELGLREETLRELMAPARPPLHGFRDACLKVEVPFSLGFMKPSGRDPFGHPSSFGAPGTGGLAGVGRTTPPVAPASGDCTPDRAPTGAAAWRGFVGSLSRTSNVSPPRRRTTRSALICSSRASPT